MLSNVVFCEDMMTSVKTLKPKQLNAIRLLAAGTPSYQVAERLEITTMTLYRWQRLPEFEQTLHAIAYSGLDEIAKKVNVAALTAIETVQEILCNMTEPSDVRLKAAMVALKAMPLVNGALEKGMAHREADFDLRKRFSGPAFTYASNGQPCATFGRKPVIAGIGLMPDDGVAV
jgi:hypothetical protein